MKRIILSTIVILAIVGAIAYLESMKQHGTTAEIKELVVEAQNTTPEMSTRVLRIQEKENKYQRAVEIANPSGFINTEPFNLSEHIGKKVILIDFWTYSCINCQRTLPYLTAWDKKYRDQGLLIVGMHTPEFDFEKNTANVQRAAEKYGIEYPIVQDNDFGTWNAYRNRYWPRKYLISIDGFIEYDHIGEGGYEETEKKIQELLKERKDTLGENIQITANTIKENATANHRLTPEVYFGYAFSREQFGQSWSPEEIVKYKAPQIRNENMFYLDGTWKNNPQSMQANSSGKIYITYTASTINIVAGGNGTLHVLVDGKETDVKTQAHDLYTLDTGEYGTHMMEIGVTPGVEVYTFTFG
jgi:thiol-disulfide isomerase/thioredoxin